MEAVIQKYKILFNLQLVLEGFVDDLNQYFSIRPDEATATLFAQHQTLIKNQKSAATYLIRTDYEGAADSKPWVPLENGEKYRFQVKLKEKSFLHNTHLATYDFASQVLFVSNTTVNMTGGELLISAKLNNYTASNTYQKGFLVKSGPNNYKALQPSDPSDAHGVSDTNYWKMIDKTGISQEDLVPRSSLTISTDLDTMLVIEIDSSSSLNNSYRLLDASSKVREVSYLVRLQNNN